MPELIAKYYIDAVEQMKGKSRVIKTDDGTEHSVTEPLNVYFSEVVVF